jgi:hypothetical protein
MDTLDAQCLLMQLTDGEIRPPDLWRHEGSGTLACAYERGTSTFTWPADAVAEMARRWRDRDTSRTPRQALALRDAHERLAALADEAGLRRADVVIHDLSRAELRAVWEEEQVVIVVDGIGEADPPEA